MTWFGGFRFGSVFSLLFLNIYIYIFFIFSLSLGFSFIWLLGLFVLFFRFLGFIMVCFVFFVTWRPFACLVDFSGFSGSVSKFDLLNVILFSRVRKPKVRLKGHAGGRSSWPPRATG